MEGVKQLAIKGYLIDDLIYWTTPTQIITGHNHKYNSCDSRFTNTIIIQLWYFIKTMDDFCHGKLPYL